MKIIPSNQTLILANERGSAGGAPGTAVQASLRAASGDGVLNRVTIFAAHADASVIYLQADYSEPSPAYRTLPRTADPPATETAPGMGELSLVASHGGRSSGPTATTPYHLRRGARLYEDTQGLTGRANAPTAIDVHA